VKTFLPQNQFISNSVSHVPVDAGSAGATPCPQPPAPAVAIEVSADEIRGCAQSETEVAASVRTAAASDISDIHELFFYARKLSAEARTFVPDYPGIYQAMLDPNAPRVRLDIAGDSVWADELPLFLQKREA